MVVQQHIEKFRALLTNA